MATLVYLSLSSLPAANCQLVSDKGHRQLYFTASRMYVVRRTYSKIIIFAAADPKLCNSLPADCDKLTLNFSNLNGY